MHRYRGCNCVWMKKKKTEYTPKDKEKSLPTARANYHNLHGFRGSLKALEVLNLEYKKKI